MSELRQSQAVRTRLSASGPDDRVTGARGVAGFFREDCRPLRDSLQLEMVVAQYAIRMRDVRSPEGIPVGKATTAGVIAELELIGDPLSHAILRALAHLTTGDAGRRSAEAVARLGERGIELPAKFGDVAAARATGAWRATGGAHHGEFAFFVDFEHPLGTRHAVALFVEPRGTVKHIGLIAAISDLKPDAFHPDEMESLGTPAAAELLRELLDRTYGTDTDDYRVVIAAARARSITPDQAVTPGAT